MWYQGYPRSGLKFGLVCFQTRTEVDGYSTVPMICTVMLRCDGHTSVVWCNKARDNVSNSD